MNDSRLLVRGSVMVALALSALGCQEMGEPLAATARVVSSSGDGAPEGSECRVAIVHENRGRFVCRVEVECDGERLYGGPELGGYAYCDAEDGAWSHVWDHGFTDRDGDPWMDFDVSAGTVVVRTHQGETEVATEG